MKEFIFDELKDLHIRIKFLNKAWECAIDETEEEIYNEHIYLTSKYSQLCSAVERFISFTKELSIELIITCVCLYYSIEINDFHAKTRKREIVQARQIAMYFTRKMIRPRLPTSFIGSKIGKVDHATVLHGDKTIKNLLQSNKSIQFEVSEIQKRINKKLT